MRLIPPKNCLTIEAAPQVMAAMCGNPVPKDDAERLAVMSGWYNKRRREPDDGHWFRVIEVGRGVTGIRPGDYVCCDLFARNHKVEFPGHPGMCHYEAKHVLGRLFTEEEGGQYQYEALGYWGLVQRDPEITATVRGAKRIIVPDVASAHGAISHDVREWHDYGDKQPGVRVMYGRYVDGTLPDMAPGDVVMYQNVGVIRTPINGGVFDSVAEGAFLGVLTDPMFPEWEPPKKVDKPAALR